MTNNPDKVAALESAGIAVVERVSAEVETQESFERYLRTKQEKMGHIFDGNHITKQAPSLPPGFYSPLLRVFPAFDHRSDARSENA